MKKEVSNVIEDSKKGKNIKKDMDMSQMADLVREMPKIQELMKNYQIHMDLSNKTVADF